MPTKPHETESPLLLLSAYQAVYRDKMWLLCWKDCSLHYFYAKTVLANCIPRNWDLMSLYFVFGLFERFEKPPDSYDGGTTLLASYFQMSRLMGLFVTFHWAFICCFYWMLYLKFLFFYTSEPGIKIFFFCLFFFFFNLRKVQLTLFCFFLKPLRGKKNTVLMMQVFAF